MPAPVHIPSEKPLCLQCKSSKDVIPMIYGKPTEQLLKRWTKHEIELGGCITVNNAQPPWTCITCAILIDTPKPLDTK